MPGKSLGITDNTAARWKCACPTYKFISHKMSTREFYNHWDNGLCGNKLFLLYFSPLLFFCRSYRPLFKNILLYLLTVEDTFLVFKKEEKTVLQTSLCLQTRTENQNVKWNLLLQILREKSSETCWTISMRTKDDFVANLISTTEFVQHQF